MKNAKANKLIEELVAEVKKNGIVSDVLVPKLQELRELAKQETDPLVIRSIRMAYEHLENNGEWSFEVIKPEEDEETGEVISDETYTPEEHLSYLLSMWLNSENKYNRDEIRTITNDLQEA
jgi:hypothetical protein